MMKEQAGMLGLAVIAAALLTALSLTVNAIEDSKSKNRAQTQSSKSDANRDRDREVDRLHYPIYGGHLMSEREREEHRSKMRSMKTEQERDAYRLEHHKLMQERAKAKGIKLPEEPLKTTPPVDSAPSNSK